MSCVFYKKWSYVLQRLSIAKLIKSNQNDDNGTVVSKFGMIGFFKNMCDRWNR